MKMPFNFIEESKVAISDGTFERVNRFERASRNYRLFGDRRLLESPERRQRRVLSAHHYTDTKYRASGHLMPKMAKSRRARYNSYSADKVKHDAPIKKEKVYRKIDGSSIFEGKHYDEKQIETFVKFLNEV